MSPKIPLTQKTSEEASKAIVALLQSTYSETRIRRPEFSIRAFARKLGVSPAQLNETLKGQRRLTRKIASRLLERLELDIEESKALIEALPESQVRKQKRQPRASRVLSYVQLSTDEFRTIAHWYHLAILSLCETHGFKSDIGWIAKRFGIQKREAREAVLTLLRLGLLEQAHGARGMKKLRVTGRQFTTTNDVPDSAIRVNHSQSLEQAKVALDTVPVELREVTSTILAIHPEILPEAKKKIRQVKRELAALLEGSPRRSEVYRLNIQLFPLTQSGETK